MICCIPAELRGLRSLAALSDLGSISLVAQRLQLSPAAIHKQLKTMGDELGVPLYEKVGRNLRLTQASEVLIPYLKELLAQYDSATSALDEWKGAKRGLVRIGTGPTIGSYILPPVLKKFRSAHPGVELLVETGNTPVLLDRLANGMIDLAMIISSDLTEGRGFSVEAHWDFELVLVSHLRNPPHHPRLADLSGMRFILFPGGSRMQQPIHRYFAAHGFEPHVVMRSDNAEAIRAMIHAGLGISMLPAWIVDEDVKRGRLTPIRQREPALHSRLALVRRRAAHVPRPVQAFISQALRFEWKNPRLVTPARAPAQKTKRATS